MFTKSRGGAMWTRVLNIRIVVFLVALAISISGCRQNMLTKQQIIDVANEEAASKGLQLSEYDVYYDVGNVKSQQIIADIKNDGSVFSERFKALEGRDYQAVIYKLKGRYVAGGRLTVFVDRRTGEVITWFGEK
jgi:hypothetical protein